MCEECGCGEKTAMVCAKCGERMVLINSVPVCTACGARGEPAGHAHEGHHHHDHEHSHEGHDHPHEHTHSAEPARRGPDEMTRLRVLLPHWLEHNDEHLHDLRAWAATARELDQGEAAALIEEAIEQMEAGNRALAAALAALGE